MRPNKHAVCAHCDPAPANLYHCYSPVAQRLRGFARKAENFVDSLIRRLRIESTVSALEEPFLHAMLFILSIPGIIRIAPLSQGDRTEVRNRTLVLADEAIRRGYRVDTVRFLYSITELFRIHTPNNNLVFHALPCANTVAHSPINLDDKYALKQFLYAHNFPHAPGRLFSGVRGAIRHSHSMRFPLVVKPRFGSLSRHTTTNIKNVKDLSEAIRVAKMIADEFIVEEHVEGENYRVTLVGHRVVACALRERANIVGDGTHTISELIARKNHDRRRGHHCQINATLHKIAVTSQMLAVLRSQGLLTSSIPPHGQKIYLHGKIILSSGADIHDVTDAVHPKNKELMETISRLLCAPLVGFDVIASDISLPYDESQLVIIEGNSAPFIDMHHFPASGKSRNVAAALLDWRLEHKKT